MLATAKIASRPARLDAGWTALRLAAPYLMAAYVAYILGWYLPFKFAPDSYLFQVLEDWAGRPWVEPYFRYFTGAVEGLTIVLLFVPGLQVLGAGMAFATMASAIGLHLFTPLGVDPYNDGGTLFKEACTNLVLAAGILVMRRREILPLARLFLTDRRLARPL
jgi:integral membrane sensor domain MASE1